jgi:multidrug efflux pump subunit AcrB
MAMRWWVVGGMACCWRRGAAVPALPHELAPQEDQGLVIGFRTAPEGATIDYTDKYAHQMEEAFKGIPEMDRFFEIVGFNGVTSAIGFVGLKDWSERSAPRRTSPVAVPAVHGHHRPDGLPGHAAAAGPERLRPAGELRGADHRHLGRPRCLVQRMLAKIRTNPEPEPTPTPTSSSTSPSCAWRRTATRSPAIGTSVDHVGARSRPCSAAAASPASRRAASSTT